LTLIVLGSCSEGFAGKGPAEGLGHGLIEAGDKCLDAFFEPGGGFEIAPAQKLSVSPKTS
jgi:hypothetical protein